GDLNTLYEKDVALPEGTVIAEATAADAADPALAALAAVAASHSRFHRDERLPQDACNRLYEIWLERSLRREIADEVLIARAGRLPVGFMTLRVSSATHADIPLIAVDDSAQHRGVGWALGGAIHRAARRRGLRYLRNVVAADNSAVRTLIEHARYELEGV